MVKLFFENVDFEIFSATMKILENFQNVRKNYFWLENKMMGSYKPESFGLMILQCSQAEKYKFKILLFFTFPAFRWVFKNFKRFYWTNTSEFRAEKVP